MTTSEVLTREQADVLTAYGWSAADILLTPEEGISSARSSCYGRHGGSWDPQLWNWTTTERGIVAWRAPEEPHDGVVLTWGQLRAAAKALPDRQRADLHRARRAARRELQRTVAPYLAGGQAPFVSPPPAWRRDADRRLLDALAAACDALVSVDELALFEVSA